MCFGCVTLCHQICVVLLRVNVCKIRQFLLHYVLHIHALQHHMFHSSKSSLGCPCFCRLTVNMVHENFFMSQFLQKMCFVTIPSATPVVKAYNSASAELKLTVCCVCDHAVSVAFPHCTTPPLVPLHVVAWPAQSSSVYTFTNFGGVMISIRLFAFGAPFWYLTKRFKFISSLSVGHVIFLAVSFTLYMTSARSWHMCNSFPTIVLCIARFSLSSSTGDSVVGVLFTLGVITGFASSKPRTFITFRMYFGFASTEYPRAVRSITLPRK